MMDDGTTVTYHKTINATCKEKKLMDVFSGWELDLPKPLDKIQVRINSHLCPRTQKSSLIIQDKLYTSFPMRLRGRGGSYSCSWRELCRIFPAFKFSRRAASHEWTHGDWRVNINSVSGTRLKHKHLFDLYCCSR